MYEGGRRDDGMLMRHVLGANLHVGASWQGSCLSWSAVFDNLLAKSESSHSPETEPCKQKPFAVTVECSSKCSHRGPREATGAISLTVIPEELGPLTITVASQRTDTGATSTVTLPSVLVVLPDRLELRCATDPDSGRTTPCGPDGVPASYPVLTAAIHVDDRTETSSALRVNGQPIDDTNIQRISLADLYPDAREGDGVKPGTYPVTLAVGPTTSTWQVAAR